MENIETNEPQENEIPTLPQRPYWRKLLNRLGCLLLFMVWLVVMAMPCFFVTLVVEKEIIYSRSELPEDEIRLFLLDDPDQRGFGLQIGSIRSGGAEEGEYCVATSVHYLMWKGEEENVSFCNCYVVLGDQWTPTIMGGDANCQDISQNSLE